MLIVSDDSDNSVSDSDDCWQDDDWEEEDADHLSFVRDEEQQTSGTHPQLTSGTSRTSWHWSWLTSGSREEDWILTHRWSESKIF